MAIIDQNEIDSLLQEASGLAAETASRLAGDEPGSETAAKPAQVAAPPKPKQLIVSEKTKRVLRIRVPVVAQLAHRPMSIEDVRELSVGAIIEFEKCVESPLDLLVNERRIGSGVCVKVGENFGLRITSMIPPRKRVEAMGP